VALSASGLIDAALANPVNVTLLERLPAISLPQCLLTAGCLYQAWWNTCVAIDVASGELYAPFGLDELERGLLRCNPLTPQPELFVRKAESYQARWPWLTLID